MKTGLVSTSKKAKKNPYGFLPVLAGAAGKTAFSAAAPYLLPAAIGAGAFWYFTRDSGPSKATPLSSLFSGPVLIGAGLGYAAGGAAKLDMSTRIAMTAVGLGTGWAIQHYIIAPAAYERAYEQQLTEEAAEFRWYKPWTW